MVLVAEDSFKFPSEEPRSVLFQSDTLLANQYHALFRRTNHLEPEKRLMTAILEDGISCFQKYLMAKDKKGKELFREAEEWIIEKEPDWLFSFDNICETLELEPNYLRGGLLRWKEMNIRGCRGAEGCKPSPTKTRRGYQPEACRPRSVDKGRLRRWNFRPPSSAPPSPR